MMSNQKITDIYKQAIDTYGVRAQKLMAIEEMSELTKEICKDFRGKLNREHLIEEIVDVIITIDQLMMMYEISGDEIQQMRERKMERLKERLEMVNDEIK